MDGSTKAKQKLTLLKAQYEELSTSKAENSLIQLYDLYVITNMRGGKATGPDGLPVDIYKIFKDKLTEPILSMYEEARTRPKLTGPVGFVGPKKYSNEAGQVGPQALFL